MNITVYTIAYNEEMLIQFMIDHYRLRFPNCHIIVYDNSSTDNTVFIAKKNNCEIRTYNSNNTLDDGIHAQIKNTCWKTAKTDWVLVCDLDELLDINEQELKNEEALGSTRIQALGLSMVNMENNYDIPSIDHAVAENRYDKFMLFNKKFISEMNYGVGAHDCNSMGIIKDGSKQYPMYHYKYINVEHHVAKRQLTAKRLSEANLKNNWGVPQALRTELELRDEFKSFQDRALKIK